LQQEYANEQVHMIDEVINQDDTKDYLQKFLDASVVD
jgi:hypothetical protein